MPKAGWPLAHVATSLGRASRSQVLHRHRRNRRLAQPGPQVLRCPGQVADFEPCDGRDPHQAALDPAGPVGGVVAKIRRFLGFTRPVAVLLIAILHFMPDAERPAELSGFAGAEVRKKGRRCSEMRKKMAGIREERR
jgi:S-adenosyl methyltransferase